MNNIQRKELAQWAGDHARRKGASDVAVSISRSRSVQVEVREQRIENIKESTENSLYLQIYHDHKYSSHTTNNLNKDQLKRFIDEAVMSTQYLGEDKDRTLPDPELYPKGKPLDLNTYDTDHDAVTPEFRVETAMKAEQLIRQGNTEILSASAGFRDNAYESVKYHTNGFLGESSGTFFNKSASVSMMDKDSRPSGSFYAGSRFLNLLPDENNLAEKALLDALSQFGQGKIASGKYAMIVDNRVAGNLLWRLFQPMTARALQQKSSFLDGMMGKAIGSKYLTIIDDPLIPGGMASRYFDNEGIASQKRIMIDKGILADWYIDNYYGKKLGMKPNGGSTSNILMETGKRSQKQIIADTQKGILITSFNGGNANNTTGDFSFGISGQLIENGKIVRAVNEMNISGNFGKLFHQLTETGNDPNPYSSLQSPTLAFLDVDFSGL
ncbi:MAG: TldD/PmbA family protein [Bacteroidota bacterium]